MIKTAAVATLALATAAPVQAFQVQSNVSLAGYEVRIVESGSRYLPDYITLYGPNGIEDIKVTCSPFSWNAYGPNQESLIRSAVEQWCFD